MLVVDAHLILVSADTGPLPIRTSIAERINTMTKIFFNSFICVTSLNYLN